MSYRELQHNYYEKKMHLIFDWDYKALTYIIGRSIEFPSAAIPVGNILLQKKWTSIHTHYSVGSISSKFTEDQIVLSI